MSAAAAVLGDPRVHHRRTTSTNERARELAAAGAPHGTLVTAEEQTSGHGRHGREWWAPPGDSLLMSLVLRRAPAVLPLAAAAAACEALAGATDLAPLIKWPNDIVLERPPSASGGVEPRLAKLAGILVEGRPQEEWVVLGIGVNVAVAPDSAPPAVRDSLASLGLHRDAIEPLLESLVRSLERHLEEPAAATLASWRARDVLQGRMVGWTRAEQRGGEPGAGRGRARGIDGDGRLVVELDGGGSLALSAGEVHLLAGEP